MTLDTKYSRVAEEAALVFGGVAAMEGLHLNPELIRPAAAWRVGKLLRGLEHFVRRLIIVMALIFEHEIDVDMSEAPIPKKQRERTFAPRKWGLRILQTERTPDPYALMRLQLKADTGQLEPRATGPVPAAPLIDRIEGLRKILGDVEARARRYAHTLARHRHYAIFAPGPPRAPNALGLAVSTHYRLLGGECIRLSRSGRPPPKGLRPRPPPRILYP